MFVSSMTKEELEAAAYKDFLEMAPRVRVAFERFRKVVNGNSKSYRLLHSLNEYHVYRTRAGNTWNISFLHGGFVNGKLCVNCLSYCQLPRERGTDYLFIVGPMTRFVVELLSAHFLRRYQERFLEPNHIDLKGMFPGVYFFINNPIRDEFFFMPEKGEEKGEKLRNFVLTDQGMSRVRLDGHIVTYVTFLDQDTLTPFKQEIYEERMFVQMVNTLNQPEEKIPAQYLAVFRKILENKERTLEIMKRVHQRTLLWSTKTNQESTKKLMLFFEENWDFLVRRFTLLREMSEKMYQKKKFRDFNGDKMCVPNISGILKKEKKEKKAD